MEEGRIQRKIKGEKFVIIYCIFSKTEKEGHRGIKFEASEDSCISRTIH